MSSLWLEGDYMRGPESGEAVEVGRGQWAGVGSCRNLYVTLLRLSLS